MTLGKRIINNIISVFELQDMTRLTKTSYEHLILYSGFIAHYSHNGFINTYKDDLPLFTKRLFNNLMRLKRQGYFDNPTSYLLDDPYNDMTKLDVQKELLLYLSNNMNKVLTTRQAISQDKELSILRDKEIHEQFLLRNNI